MSLANLLKANPSMDKSGRLSIGQEIMIPTSAANLPVNVSPAPVADIPSALSVNSHKVEKGILFPESRGNIISGFLNLEGQQYVHVFHYQTRANIVYTGNSSSQQSLSPQAPVVAP